MNKHFSPAKLGNGSPSQSPWHCVNPVESCRARLHREPFTITHALAGSPLFEIGALIEVAKEAKQREGDVYFDAGKVAIDDKWGQIPVPDMPVEEVISRVQNNGAWIILKHVEKRPEYRRVLEEFATFVRGVAGPEGADVIRNPEMLVIVSSPNRLTPFHFDAEINFLVQVRGSKQVWICDPNDRSVVSDHDLETYYSKTITAGQYRPDVEAKAKSFVLKPGDGVHIPTYAAHWVQNGNDVSVSLSLNFEFPSHRYRDVYRINHELRKLGLKPSPPGRAAIIDRSKSLVASAATHLTRAIRRS